MFNWKMTSYVLLLLSMAGTSMSSETLTTISSNNNPSQDASSNGRSRTTLTLPLINHHTMTRRRMLEMGLDENEMDSYLDSLPQRPSRRTSLEVGGLYQGYGTHYVDLWVGTPPQRQTVIVDTGSGVTAFPCSACKDCGKGYHASPFFVEADSSSFDKNKCDSCSQRGTCTNKNKNDEHCKIGVSYQEGSSWSAYQAVDKTYLGGPHDEGLIIKAFEAGDEKFLSSGIIDENPEDAASFSFPLQFGCQTSVTGLFKTQLADGIMGMCISKGAFWHQMFDAGIIEHQQFSLCFSREAESSSKGTPAGAVTMGGVDTNLHKSPMVFADGHAASGMMHGVAMRKVYLLKSGQYDVTEVTKSTTVEIDITTEKLNSGKIILDSGTTDTYFTRNIAKAFMKVFKSEVGVDYNTRGMKLTDEQVEKLPSVVVQLNGYKGNTKISDSDTHPGLAGKLDPDHPNDVLVVIPPNHYFEYSSKEDRYHPRIYLTEGSGTVLGANFMAGHDVLFDISENNRIGFAVSDCSYDALSTDQNATYPKPEVTTPGKIIPAGNTDNGDACDSFACRYRIAIIFLGLISILAIRMKYVSYNQDLEEYRRSQSDILSDLYLDEELEEEIDGGIMKEMEMREIT